MWSKEDHKKLIEAIRKFGNNWTKIASHFITKDRQQVRYQALALKRNFEKNPYLPGADILPIL